MQRRCRGDRLEREEQFRNHVKTERRGLCEMQRRWREDKLEREEQIRNRVKMKQHCKNGKRIARGQIG